MLDPSKGATVPGGSNLTKTFARNMPAGPVGGGERIQPPARTPMPVLGSMAPAPAQMGAVAPEPPKGFEDVGGKEIFFAYKPGSPEGWDDYTRLQELREESFKTDKPGFFAPGTFMNPKTREIWKQPQPAQGGAVAPGMPAASVAPAQGAFPSQAQLLARAMNDMARQGR